MLSNKYKYILTWISLVLFLLCSTLLVAAAWNSQVTGDFSPFLVILLWILICFSGIFLFMLAVKMAHRQWMTEKREQEKEEAEGKQKPSGAGGSSRKNKELDFAASARKIVRRIPENIVMDQLGKLLLKNLARELEIMSGIFYTEKKGVFTAEASYAMTSSTESYTFKSGEGLTGQAARNQQILVLNRLPEGYTEVFSGLGMAAPAYLAIVPLVHKGHTIAVLEFTGYRYEPGAIENMLRIFARDLMDKLSINPG